MRMVKPISSRRSFCRNRQFIQHCAMLGMITMQSWMFLSSFEALRRKLLDSSSIETMAHLGAGAIR